ncbi:S1/P1 nuclease [Terriglobus saanensis]|uniref:Nuclease n=1 Tax=Terriglobus saanensis (strain ATCC BAA-1853 / DSM 23119 / SP1PR4) TaxID=401053 RepID=E8V4T3_TERSS|nr:S1/P1 nuclease [Terriglobus saanensis]ADV81487.1 hypothetical protein AciPR4_0653 [Terriglobus saanensis SP1PR4]
MCDMTVTITPYTCPMRKLLAAALLLTPLTAFAWGHTGHEMINKIAAEKLPADMPKFLHTKQAIEQIQYMGPEPDRWRYFKGEPELVVAQSPEHFIDLEYAWLYGKPLIRQRYDFLRQVDAQSVIQKNPKIRAEGIGLLPYATTEIWQRLKASMRNYRALQKDHKNTRAAEALVIFYAGWLGHYVADGSQPLHTTYRYNGWEGDNPNGYSNDHKIHAKFEGEFVAHNITEKEVAALVPATPTPQKEIFADFEAYITYTHTFVEKVYQLDKEHAFDGAGTPSGKAFAVERVAAGATELRDLIVFAWEQSATPEPPYKGD